MKFLTWSVTILAVLGFSGRALACINDSKTLSAEKREHPTLAQAILSPKIEQPDVKSLTEDIQKLKSNPKTNDVAWWNDLDGAYLRLGQPAEAVKILEPLINRFAGDYGIHANLGTAYHLLGRYADAEREIRRDTEINPEGHFGLEKYHLALLQYLPERSISVVEACVCGRIYRYMMSIFASPGRRLHELASHRVSEANSAHEFSGAEREAMETKADKVLHQAPGIELAPEDIENLYRLAVSDEEPAYTESWDLGRDPKLDDGVIYMASLNPKEPACQVVLRLSPGGIETFDPGKGSIPTNAIQLGSNASRQSLENI